MFKGQRFAILAMFETWSGEHFCLQNIWTTTKKELRPNSDNVQKCVAYFPSLDSHLTFVLTGVLWRSGWESDQDHRPAGGVCTPVHWQVSGEGELCREGRDLPSARCQAAEGNSALELIQCCWYGPVFCRSWPAAELSLLIKHLSMAPTREIK